MEIVLKIKTNVKFQHLNQTNKRTRTKDGWKNQRNVFHFDRIIIFYRSNLIWCLCVVINLILRSYKCTDTLYRFAYN